MTENRVRIYLSIGMTFLLVSLVTINLYEKTKADFTPVHITSDVVQYEFSVIQEPVKVISKPLPLTTASTESTEVTASTEVSETNDISGSTENNDASQSTNTTESIEPTNTESTEPTESTESADPAESTDTTEPTVTTEPPELTEPTGGNL